MGDDVNRHKGTKTSVIDICSLTVLFLSVVGVFAQIIITMSNGLNRELTEIKQVQTDQFVRYTETNQFLLSTIDWSSRRSQLTLFMRDQIVKQWKKSRVKVDLDEAYLLSEVILKECDNYPYIDPFLILATQCIESRFTKGAKSPAGALGMNQFMPATGRLLAGYFGMEYSDSLLFDIKVSTKFAVKLFDILYAQYHDWGVSLADYNGGPWQAYYYKSKKDKLVEETKNYVPNVLSKKGEYDSLFVRFKIEERIKESRVKEDKLAFK
jgi:soluble lytic murein transglycosylase-like protein